MGKLTISMAIFNSKLLNYQRVQPDCMGARGTNGVFGLSIAGKSPKPLESIYFLVHLYTYLLNLIPNFLGGEK
jgi:hypothetical protein